MASAREFRETLLPATLAHAAGTAFYAKLWSSAGVGAVTLDDLHLLPSVDKDDLRDAGAAAQVRGGSICHEVFTSGTTGPPLITLRSEREAEFIHDFFQGLHTAAEQDAPVRRCLSINNPYHGHLVAVPARMYLHKIGVYDAGSFAHGCDVLARRHDDPGIDERCTILIGLERCLRAFAMFAIDRQVQAAALDLEVVVSYSQYLTRAWRVRLEQLLGAQVIDRYSLAELFGGASSCLSCGWWHADPFLIPEVLGAHSGNLLQEGTGVLLLTSLYPFQQAQPMIRYRTRDVVEVTHSRSCSPGELAFRPLGRQRYGVPAAEGDDWLVAPVDVLEAFDEWSDIARTPRFRDSPQVADPYRIGHPRYQVSHQLRGRTRHLQLAVQPGHRLRGPARRAFTDQAADRLLVQAPALRSALADGSATLRVSAVDTVTGDLVAHSD